jgi:Na+-translocating ferredoxin:NAD+ oxidoreductase RNF subunit RnfB
MSSTTVTRQIVHIDEALCNGCGVCVSPCAEGAIVLVDGKAKVVKEELCDGAGFCLGVCPTGALTLEVRETVPFDHDAVEEHVAEQEAAAVAAGAPVYIAQHCYNCGRSEDDGPLLPVRTKGTSTWVCTRCLPALIHG